MRPPSRPISSPWSTSPCTIARAGVDVEHRGIDFALEAVVDGDPDKELRRNVGF